MALERERITLKLNKAELVFCVLAISASIYIYIESAGFFADKSYYSTVFYTQFLSAILFFLTLILFFQIILRYFKNRGTNKPQEETSVSTGFGIAHLSIIVILIASPVIFKQLGFILGGGLFMVFSMFVYLLIERKGGVNLKDAGVIFFVSIGVVFFMYVLFHNILKVPLPRSSLIY